MSPTQRPEDDGLIVMQRLTPEHFDVVLGSHPAKRKLPPSRNTWPLSSIAICLTLLAAIIYLVIQMFHTPRPAPASAAALPAVGASDEPAPLVPTAELLFKENNIPDGTHVSAVMPGSGVE